MRQVGHIENTPCINHRGNKECPVVGGKCNLRNNVYNAKIITNNTTFNYIGISEPPLRQRIATHAYSFRTNNNQTELSTKIKELKNNKIEYKLEYHLLENTDVYTPEIGRCKLCIAEVYHILYGGYSNLINSKLELTGKCRHKNKFKIGAG